MKEEAPRLIYLRDMLALAWRARAILNGCAMRTESIERLINNYTTEIVSAMNNDERGN